VRVQDISFKTKSDDKKSAKDAAAPVESAQEASGDASSSGSDDSGAGEASENSGFGSF
jgi:hypothetical protein